MADFVTGTVLARDGSAYRVMTGQGEVRAVLRGKMKRDMPKVVVGDIVRLDDADAGVRGIAGVEERRSLLERRTPQGRGARPVAANIDEVLVVTATRDPAPLLQLLDRLLVIAEVNSLPAAVLVTKIDLEDGASLGQRFRAAGYPVLRASLRTGVGLDELRAHLAGRTTVITGPSGVGKSSLANAIQPGLSLRVAAVSQKIGRGRQTTVSAVMIPLDIGGFLVDTPGFSEVGLWGAAPRELARSFPEMQEYLGRCHYPDCWHLSEPGCAVLGALAGGSIARDRWESYRTLLGELESAPRAWE